MKDSYTLAGQRSEQGKRRSKVNTNQDLITVLPYNFEVGWLQYLFVDICHPSFHFVEKVVVTNFKVRAVLMPEYGSHECFSFMATATMKSISLKGGFTFKEII